MGNLTNKYNYTTHDAEEMKDVITQLSDDNVQFGKDICDEILKFQTSSEKSKSRDQDLDTLHSLFYIQKSHEKLTQRISQL